MYKPHSNTYLTLSLNEISLAIKSSNEYSIIAYSTLYSANDILLTFSIFYFKRNGIYRPLKLIKLKTN